MSRHRGCFGRGSTVVKLEMDCATPNHRQPSVGAVRPMTKPERADVVLGTGLIRGQQCSCSVGAAIVRPNPAIPSIRVDGGAVSHTYSPLDAHMAGYRH